MLRINITTTPRLLALLDEEVKALELSRSELLRRILDARYDKAKDSENHYD
jgi:metal-responsive CopG/Arc/MetJ family transcriptional regulator